MAVEKVCTATGQAGSSEGISRPPRTHLEKRGLLSPVSTGLFTRSPQTRKRLPVHVSSFEKVLPVVSEMYGVSREQILSKSRRAKIVRARHVACLLLRLYFRMPYPVMGRLLHRDHSTCIHGAHAALEKATAEELEVLRDRCCPQYPQP